MKQIMLQEKYPLFVAEIDKRETDLKSVDALIDYYKARIAENPKVKFIGVFDHYAHTKAIDGDIAPGITAAVDIIFCFGFAIPSASASWKLRCNPPTRPWKRGPAGCAKTDGAQSTKPRHIADRGFSTSVFQPDFAVDRSIRQPWQRLAAAATP